MPSLSKSTVHNRLLGLLPDDDFAAVVQDLHPVELPLRKVLVESNTPIRHLYFLDRGIASVVNGSVSGKIELGIIGFEGLVGTPVLLGIDRTPHEVFMQVEGRGLQIDATAIVSLMEQRPALRRALLRYVYALNVQTSETAYANANSSVESRLARWLLMCHDRLPGDDIPLTHEFMATMLGVRRAGVTVALHILEGSKLVRAKRGVVTLLDRERLIELADEAYGVAEAEYERIMSENDEASDRSHVARRRIGPAQ